MPNYDQLFLEKMNEVRNDDQKGHTHFRDLLRCTP